MCKTTMFKKNMLKKLAVLGLASGCSVAVFSTQAEPSAYLGVQYGQQSVDDASWDFGVLSAVAGYQFNEVLAIEGRLGAGIKDEKYSDGISSARLGIDHSYSVLGKASLPVWETFSLYAIAGFNKTKYDFEINDDDDLRETHSEDGFTYGAGAELRFTPNFSLTLEYAVLPELGDDEDDLDVDSISASLNYRF
jgi:opacity protein-like surface antigen